MQSFSSVVILAVLAAGCNAGSIGSGNEPGEPFSPAADDANADETRADPETREPVDESPSDAAIEDPDNTPGTSVAEDSSVVDTGSSGAPDTTVVDTGSSGAPDTTVVDTGSSGAPDTSIVVDSSPPVVWRRANLTWFTSYPDPGSEECIKYSGCEWAGQFAALSSKMPESWVRANNIAAVHGKDFAAYKLKTLRLRQGTKQIDVKVYDMCADSDCSGCCTKNSSSTGFLIDVEKYTAERFGTNSGVVEWTCLDC